MSDLLLPAVRRGSTGPDLDPYYNLVSLHLKGDVNTGRNYNAFSDASSNNFRLTNDGDVRGSSLSPFNSSWSIYLNGSSTFTAPAALQTAFAGWGGRTRTFEVWIYRDSATDYSLQTAYAAVADGSRWHITISNNKLRFGWLVDGGSTEVAISTTATIPLGWVHLSVTNNATTASNATVYLGINGVVETFTGLNFSTHTAASTRVWNDLFGYTQYMPATFKGYFTGLRWSNNLRYTSNYPIPTSSFVPDANTLFLLGQRNRFIDQSNSAIAVAVSTGTPTISPFAPFVETDTTTGSGYFDGTGDYLSTTVTVSDFYTALGDFTFEGWVYPLSFSGPLYSCPLFSSTNDDLMLRAMPTTATSTSLNIYGIRSDNGAAFGNSGISGGTIRLNEWAWIVFTRQSGVLNLWVNGTRVVNDSTYTSIQLRQTATSLRIGGAFAGSSPNWNGYLSGIKWTSGAALYSDATIPMPTAPATTSVSSGTLRLLTLQERGAYNTIGFEDDSENDFPITRSGNVAQGTFSPFSNAGWSNYFSGVSDFLSYSTITLGASFTIEFFVYFPTTPSANAVIISNIGAGGTNWVGVSNTAISLSYSAGTRTFAFTPAGGTWYYVQLINSASSLTCYVNGTQVGTAQTGPSSFTLDRVGGYTNVGFTGYLSSVRVNSTALAVSALPTSPLTEVANTVLLTCQSNRFIDNRASPLTLTRGGSLSVAPFSPFKPVAYDPVLHGGSAYFDGTSDFLNTPATGQFVATGDFTIQLWFYLTSLAAQRTLIGNYTSTSATDWLIDVTTTGVLQVFIDGSTLRLSHPGITTGQWYFVRVSRSGSTVTGQINGANFGTTATYTTSATIGSATKAVYLGMRSGSSFPMLGYMSGIALVPGSVLTGVPTAPAIASPGANLLLNFTNGGVIDSTGKNVIETVGNAGVVTTTIKKYGSGSMYFDGTGDYLTTNNFSNPLLSFGTGDFTIEYWAYASSGTNNGLFQLSDTAGGFKASQANSLAMNIFTNNAVSIYANGTSYQAPNNTLPYNSWTHFAIVRSSNVTKLYANGSLITSIGSSGSITDNTNYTGTYIVVGGYYSTGYLFTGYIDDFRVTRGYARYVTGTGANANQMVFNGTNTLALPTKAFPDRGTTDQASYELGAPSNVEALVVGGGGGGGYGGASGGGGGAGGFREFVGGNAIAVAGSTNYAISVGAGGTGGTSTVARSDGLPSTFGSVTAIGGGGGGGVASVVNSPGSNGGSGGGGQGNSGNSGAGGKGVYPGSTYLDATRQGYDGGAGATTFHGGGGGGAGGAGAAASTTAGVGGVGAQSSITGVATFYAGGGGGGSGSGGGTGGNGGGGNGGTGDPSNGSAGTANTGGGGGGSRGGTGVGGAGGSGVVILAYPTSFRPLRASVGLTFTIDTVTRPGYRVYRFTAGSGTISW